MVLSLSWLLQPPIRLAINPVTTTEVMVTVENPAMIIFGKIWPSIAATSSGVSPAPRAASWDRIIVPGKPYSEVNPMAIDIGIV